MANQHPCAVKDCDNTVYNPNKQFCRDHEFFSVFNERHPEHEKTLHEAFSTTCEVPSCKSRVIGPDQKRCSMHNVQVSVPAGRGKIYGHA